MKRGLYAFGLLSLIACNKKENDHEHPIQAPPKVSHELMLSESQIRLANITLQPVQIKSIGQTLALNAKLTVDEQRSEVISVRAAGRVEKLFIKETGQFVRKGEPLYALYSETLLTLQREYLLAKEQYESLESNNPRYESFLKAAGKKLLLYGLTPEHIDQLAKRRSVQPHITFPSPATGVVTEITAAEGLYLPEGGSLYKIENIDVLWVEAEMYPDETALVKTGDAIRVRVNGFESAPVDATVIFVGPEYRANSQLTTVRAAIKNPSLKFKPGMQAQVFLTHSSRETVAVPVDAVIRDEKGAHVFIARNGHTFFPRKVKIGAEDFEDVEILEGISPGDTIAVSGSYLLNSELILKRGGEPMAAHQH